MKFVYDKINICWHLCTICVSCWLKWAKPVTFGKLLFMKKSMKDTKIYLRVKSPAVDFWGMPYNNIQRYWWSGKNWKGCLIKKFCTSYKKIRRGSFSTEVEQSFYNYCSSRFFYCLLVWLGRELNFIFFAQNKKSVAVFLLQNHLITFHRISHKKNCSKALTSYFFQSIRTDPTYKSWVAG